MKDSLTKAVDQIMVNAAMKASDAKAKPEDAAVKAEDATSGQAAASTTNAVKPIVNIIEPFSKRELKTTAELLKLRIENMIREFESDTGTTIDSVRYVYYDRGVQLHLRLNEPDEQGLSFLYV